jgi:hypothetical protein
MLIANGSPSMRVTAYTPGTNVLASSACPDFDFSTRQLFQRQSALVALKEDILAYHYTNEGKGISPAPLLDQRLSKLRY